MKASSKNTLWNSLVRSTPGMDVNDLIRIIHEHRSATISNLAFEHFFKTLPDVWDVCQIIQACPKKSRRAFADRVWRKLQEFKLKLSFLKVLYEKVDEFKLRCVPRIIELSEGIFDYSDLLKEHPRFIPLGRAKLLTRRKATCVDIQHWIGVCGWNKSGRFINRYLDVAEKSVEELDKSFLIRIVHRGSKIQRKRAMAMIFGKKCPEFSVIEDLLESIPRTCVGLVEDVWARIISCNPRLHWFRELYYQVGLRRLHLVAAKDMLANFSIPDAELLADLYGHVPKNLRQVAVDQICAIPNPKQQSLREMISCDGGVGRQMLLDKLHATRTALGHEEIRMFVVYDNARREEYAKAALASEVSSHSLLMAIVEHAPKQARKAAARLSKDNTFLSSVRGLTFVLKFMPTKLKATVAAHQSSLNSKEYHELWNIINILHQRSETFVQSLVKAAAQRLFDNCNTEWDVAREASNMIASCPSLVDLACENLLEKGGGRVYYVNGHSEIRPDTLLMIMKKSPSNRQRAFDKIVSKSFPEGVLDRVLQIAPELKAKVREHKRKLATSTSVLMEKLFST